MAFSVNQSKGNLLKATDLLRGKAAPCGKYSRFSRDLLQISVGACSDRRLPVVTLKLEQILPALSALVEYLNCLGMRFDLESRRGHLLVGKTNETQAKDLSFSNRDSRCG